jgi:hypothetical protein
MTEDKVIERLHRAFTGDLCERLSYVKLWGTCLPTEAIADARSSGSAACCQNSARRRRFWKRFKEGSPARGRPSALPLGRGRDGRPCGEALP